MRTANGKNAGKPFITYEQLLSGAKVKYVK